MKKKQKKIPPALASKRKMEYIYYRSIQNQLQRRHQIQWISPSIRFSSINLSILNLNNSNKLFYNGDSFMNTYSTRDFYLVAYLHMLGNPIADTRLVNPNTTEFTFKANDKLQKGVNDFYSQKASVDPLSYGSSFRSIKNIIHSLKTGYVSSTTIAGTLNNEFNNKHKECVSRG